MSASQIEVQLTIKSQLMPMKKSTEPTTATVNLKNAERYLKKISSRQELKLLDLTKKLISFGKCFLLKDLAKTILLRVHTFPANLKKNGRN